MTTNIFDELARRRRRHWPGCTTRLEHAADTDDVLDVAYRTIDTPVGTLLLAATTVGLVRVAYDVEGHDAVLAGLADADQPAHPARTGTAGQRRRGRSTSISPSAAPSSTCRSTCGSRTASAATSSSICATSATATARATRQSPPRSAAPRAVRAVGTACARNPLPVVIPCHRVVRSDGSTGQYVGGPLAKSTLLDLEAA